MNHVISLVEQYGTDCWWRMPIDDLLPREVVEQADTF